MKDRQTQARSEHFACPRCGQQVPAGAEECPSCEQSLCPECGAAVGEHWPSCMACGARWDLLCPECEAVVKPRDRVCPRCGVSLEGETEELAAAPAPTPAASVLPPISGQSIPACAVCGRQDETLRLAAFPYVISLVVVTYRRAFAGLWCQKHRDRYWALSGLITALVGWFGIPFGFIYTPLTLFKLARGGEQPVAQNQHLLQVLAGHKLRLGDAAGAMRCLEVGLRVNDDEASRRRVQELYSQTQRPPLPGILRPAVAVVRRHPGRGYQRLPGGRPPGPLIRPGSA